MNRSVQRRPLLEELSKSRVRLTPQRRAVIEVIQEAKSHLGAGKLLELARKRHPAIDRATVYRTIELLKKLRLVDELDLVHWKGEKHYYEAKATQNHVHLTCSDCGQVEEYSSALFERLKSEIAAETGFNIQAARLEIGGVCQACASAEALAAARRMKP